MNTILLVDSCCNLPESFFVENQEVVDLISMPIHLGSMDFHDDHGKTLDNKLFYERLRNKEVPSTSQINPVDFEAKFKDIYEKGKEVLYVSFSSEMSGTYNNAILAKNMFLETYPDAKIDVVDSRSASVGYGAFVYEIVKKIKSGDSGLVQWIEENKLKVNHKFTVDDLNFLKRGGRIPPPLATIGTVLNLKPLMSVDKNGKLVQSTKVRGRKKVFNLFIDILKEKHIDGNTIFIGHGDCLTDAEKLREMILSEIETAEVQITYVTPTIGAHTGPGMMVIGFLGKERD